MDCVCGCGRDTPRKLANRNFIAAAVALELLTWDRNRASGGNVVDGREALIARGADRYAWLVSSLHGERAADPDEAAEEWLAESRERRAGRSDLTERRLLGGGTPNLSKEDVERLDRRHPERSFTGTGEREAPPGAGNPVDSDLVDKLERLRRLRDDDILTEDEFKAAKALLLDG